jgi:endonuclease G
MKTETILIQSLKREITFYIGKNKEDNFKVIAFRFPEEGVEKKFQLKNFLCSIDSIEESTGIDFFSELDDAEEEKIEEELPLDVWK